MARILILDDDFEYLAALADGLEAMNHQVTTATMVKEGLTLLATYEFDLVIVDTIMPGGGAITFVHDARARNINIPIIVATGRPEIADSPVFSEGLQEAAAKIDKSSTLSEVDHIIRSVLTG